MRYACIALLCFVIVSCGTPGINYEYVDQYGNPVRFSMVGDLGATTNEGITDRNNVNLPVLGAVTNPGGGGVDQSRNITQTVTPEQGSITLPDGTSISGVFTTSPVVRERWTGLRGVAKSIAATLMWWKTNDEMGKTIRHRKSEDVRESVTNRSTDASLGAVQARENAKTTRVLSRR